MILILAQKIPTNLTLSQPDMNDSTLTPKLLEVCQLIATGLTYTQIAQATATPRSTIGRWAKLPAVIEQVKLLRSETAQVHREVQREVATEQAQTLQESLAISAKRQKLLIDRGHKLANELHDLNEQLIVKASEILLSGRVIESHEKTLITLLPAYFRTATEMQRNLSDVEDKHLAIEEISKRLDEWEDFRNQSSLN